MQKGGSGDARRCSGRGDGKVKRIDGGGSEEGKEGGTGVAGKGRKETVN